MGMEELLSRYVELLNTEKFAKYQKDFAAKIQNALCDAYEEGCYEHDIVSIVGSIVNGVNGLCTSNGKFKISTNSVFIHGLKSLVEFEYHGQKAKRELGDLVFIISIVYNRKKYFEKFTISQFKKDTIKNSWDLSNKEQLYLLSRFPSFRGIKGIIPKKEYNLHNYSGCLGSYSLLYSPGDFAFVSAPRLESYLGKKKSIDIADMFQLQEQTNYCFALPMPQHWRYSHVLINELIHVSYKMYKYGGLRRFPYCLPFPIGIGGTSCYARHLHDYTDKYLRSFIGEPTYAEIGIYNPQARIFLLELLSATLKKVRAEKKKAAVNFLREFLNYSYGDNQRGGFQEEVEFDYEDGGIGIICTVVDLGEGK